MHTLSTILAFSWDPELRGILAVLIGGAILVGSVYALLATNLGSRLGFLVGLAGLFGWITLMGLIWWAYGIGYQGDAPTWVGKEIIRDGRLSDAVNEVARVPDLTQATTGQRVGGWIRLPDDDPGRGQAVAAADDILVNVEGIFDTGEYIPVAVFDEGGEAWPKIGSFDLLAFFHRPHHALVQVQPVIPQRTEPGRAPPPPEPDPNQPPTFVLMERDLGNRRQPAMLITLGSALVFGLVCHTLHRREKLASAHRSGALEPAPAG